MLCAAAFNGIQWQEEGGEKRGKWVRKKHLEAALDEVDHLVFELQGQATQQR